MRFLRSLCVCSAVKSVVGPGDKVVCMSNGVFGSGFADIARAAGGEVTLLESDWQRELNPQVT